ncbi:MAG: hypothetical protein AB7M12_13750 [Hyphomonadaceae bacterium]
MKNFGLFYEYVPDIAARRESDREIATAHVAHVRAARDRGDIVFGAPFADAPPGAVLVFKGETAAEVEAFAKADPFVIHKIVTTWRVREFATPPSAAKPS